MDRERMEKESRLLELEGKMLIPFDYMDYYDYDSDKLLDEKIRVLEQLDAGNAFEAIPGSFDILENYPKREFGKDYVI